MLNDLKSNLELKIRLLKGEIRENDREKEKCLNAVAGLIGCFVSLIIGCFYYKQEIETKTWMIFPIVLLGLFCFILGFYWYSKYKSAGKKIERLKKELYLLKKGLIQGKNKSD